MGVHKQHSNISALQVQRQAQEQPHERDPQDIALHKSPVQFLYPYQLKQLQGLQPIDYIPQRTFHKLFL